MHLTDPRDSPQEPRVPLIKPGEPLSKPRRRSKYTQSPSLDKMHNSSPEKYRKILKPMTMILQRLCEQFQAKDFCQTDAL